MVDASIEDVIHSCALKQHLKTPEDLWHAITLYSTEEITKQLINPDATAVQAMDNERAQMFERNGWHDILLALQRDWQPYLNGKSTFQFALAKLVRDTSK
jgi:hypothetical protein